MSDKSAIEWTDATWNPIRGCTKISPGCKYGRGITEFQLIVGRCEDTLKRRLQRLREFCDPSISSHGVFHFVLDIPNRKTTFNEC
jgi:hypothetical protein